MSDDKQALPTMMYRKLDGRKPEHKRIASEGGWYESHVFADPSEVPQGEGWADEPPAEDAP